MKFPNSSNLEFDTLIPNQITSPSSSYKRSLHTVTILIVDGNSENPESSNHIFNNDPRFSVIGECKNGSEAVELAKSLKPQVVLMEINLPGISGIDATLKITESVPECKIIGFSVYNKPVFARKMIQNGAWGYVTKRSSKEELIKAILTIQMGKKYICDDVKNVLSDQIMRGANPNKGNTILSRRESEVIQLLKNGHSSKQIGEALTISEKTVETHKYNILRKLHLKNTNDLFKFIHA